MTFASLTFLIFFTAILAVMGFLNIPAIERKIKNAGNVRKIILLIASYIFYGWWNWKFCFLMLALTVIAYISARKISSSKHAKAYLILGVTFPLVILGIFKYFNFFVGSFVQIFGISNYSALKIILPVGISFYTFQSLSYTIDVYRKKLPVCTSFTDLALYIAFFPQLVAGPIVKAEDFIPQLSQDRKMTLKTLEKGVQIFLIGLFKKIVIADNLSVFVDEVFDAPTAVSSATVALAVIGYSIQIYFDFSGYSDMAIGCAKCLGYDLNKNFNLPYISKNVSEFWKRWHISLSNWLMEYLYIPLGGNRKGKARTYLNLMITMVLGGLWHGASWNFVFWGALHGAALCVNKMFVSFKKKHNIYGKLGFVGTIISTAFTYIFVCICWVFFRAEDFSTATAVLRKLVVWENGVTHVFSWVLIAVIVVIGEVLISYFLGKKSNEVSKFKVNGNYLVLDLTKILNLFLVFVFAGFILITAYTGANPFIYFQF